MNRYRCEVAELHASRAGKQAMTELLLRHQTTKGDAPARGRHLLRTALLAAAVTALLATAALALSPTLRDALTNALGGFVPYAQDLTDQGLSCTDQGIQVKVVSVLADGNVYRVYFTFQDLEDDRLDLDTYTDIRIETPANNEVPWAAMGGGYDQLAYDEATKTALFYYQIIGDGPPAGELTLRLSGETIQPGYRTDSIEVDLSLLAQETLKTKGVEGRTVLVPEQNPAELASSLCDLSAYGFGDDGLLHIQVRLHVPVVEHDEGDIRIHIDSRSYKTDPELGLSRTIRYNRTHNWDGGMGISYEEWKNLEWEPSEVYFTQDGVSYCDVVTGVTLADMDDAELGGLNLFLKTKPEIQGQWSIEVPTTILSTREIDMADSTNLWGIEAKAFYLTRIGATLESDPNGQAGSLNYELTLYFADGSHTSCGHPTGGFHLGGYNTNHWTFDQPIDPKTVTAMALGLWYVPIEDGVAQSGHWLAEQP